MNAMQVAALYRYLESEQWWVNGFYHGQAGSERFDKKVGKYDFTLYVGDDFYLQIGDNERQMAESTRLYSLADLIAHVLDYINRA